ncbi:Uncharacterised protein [Mycobacterium tuberculosis]|uniref:Uncharacterized protein n=1 Tax=Mycobacterium tuberculosis TaxID=1773 RepID=A0A0U0UBQ2_MYCTX|nr:Uncharacterised protein [Mycobacterium tuberculosis]COY96988.1 Uncharacterised protein [Mycobacterium tuberculosis]COY97866.1 Uncharacterised protein [Mycobacterium tuberculosis]
MVGSLSRVTGHRGGDDGKHSGDKQHNVPEPASVQPQRRRNHQRADRRNNPPACHLGGGDGVR